MLVLSRRVGERIQIGDNVTLVVNRIVGNRVTLGIEAPKDILIVRGELPPLTRKMLPLVGKIPENQAFPLLSKTSS